MPYPTPSKVAEMYHVTCNEELRRLTGGASPNHLARLSPEEIQMVAERATISCPAPNGVPYEVKIAWMVEAERLACIVLSRQVLPRDDAEQDNPMLSTRPRWLQELALGVDQNEELQAAPPQSTGKPASGSRPAVEQLTLL